MKPPTRPKVTRREVERVVRDYGVSDPVVLVGFRGYYAKMGKDPRGNDRGIYDDALAVLTPTSFRTFNFNTDPSVYRSGIATLAEGVHRYRKGQHGLSRGNPYPALRPATAGEVLPVTRDGQTGTKRGIALNIHRGGVYGTSSEGCQTLPPSDYDEFLREVYAAMDMHGLKTIPYVLTTRVPS